MQSREFIEFRTSCLVTALAQWDMPYEWAPVMGLVTEGLAGYGDMRNVKRISGKFTDVVRTNFARDYTIGEKYHVLNSSSEFHPTGTGY